MLWLLVSIGAIVGFTAVVTQVLRNPQEKAGAWVIAGLLILFTLYLWHESEQRKVAARAMDLMNKAREYERNQQNRW